MNVQPFHPAAAVPASRMAGSAGRRRADPRPLPVLDRQTLYDEVWSVPRIHLRARYGLTDHEFRKLCRALRIPLPRAGHWSRVAAGHRIVPPPLPR
ncbi:MAG: hypothetical protein QM674_16410 [Burkholderiaceae bacterium]